MIQPIAPSRRTARPVNARTVNTRTAAGLLAVATAALLAVHPPARAGSLYWDTASTGGLNGGPGIWWDGAGASPGVTNNWATSTSPGNGIVPGEWIQDSDAIFGTTVENTVTLSGTIRVNSLTQISNTLGTFGTTLSGGTLQIGAGGYTSSLSHPMDIVSNVNLAADQTWNTNTALTVDGIIGETGGSFGFVKTGNNTLTLTNANVYTGATTVNYGAMTLSGNGSIASLGGLTISAGGAVAGTSLPQVVLDNTAANSNNRIAGNVTLGLAGELKLIGNSDVDTTEAIGSVTFDTGASLLTISQNTAGRFATLAATSLSRANHATAVIRGSFFGTNDTRGARISLTAAPSGADFIGAGGAPAGTTTTKNLAIVPWLLSGNFDGSAGNGFATYDTTRNTLRPLASGEMDSLTDSYATDGNNVTAGTGTVNLTAGPRTFNSLLVAGGATVHGAGDSLTITSGALAFTSGTSTFDGFSAITLGNGEGVIHVTGTQATLDSPIDVTNGGGLTKSGANPLILTAHNLYSGQTIVNQGTLQVGNGGATGDLGASSAIVLNGGSLTFNRSDNVAYGNISGIATVNNGTTGNLTQAGSGTLTLNGTNFIPGALNVTAGGLTITGDTTAAVPGNNNNVIGTAAGLSTLTLSGSASLTTTANLVLANAANVRTRAYLGAGSTLTVGNLLTVGGGGTLGSGALYQSGGTVSTQGTGEPTLAVGGAGGYGFYAMADGDINAAKRIRIGSGDKSTGVFYQTGGDVVTQNFDVSGGGSSTTNTLGVFYATGGTFTATGGSNVGYTAGRGEMTIAGDAVVTAEITLGNNTNIASILNLNSGGTLQSKKLDSTSAALGTGFRHVNFDGGTLRYTGTSSATQFINASNLYSVFIRPGGATLDVVNSAVTATVSQPLIAPTGDGITASTYAITNGGSGYIGAPVVAISGATGATAVANMVDDGTGNGTFKVASITITSPGIDAAGTPTVAFSGGGALTPADATGVSLATTANLSGGLTKVGDGTLALNAANTYTGNTTIESGKLTLGANGSIDNSSAVDVFSGATFDVSQKAAGYTIHALQGGGSALAKAGQSLTVDTTLSPGHSLDTLTITQGNFTLADDAVYAYEIGGTTASPQSDLVSLTNAASNLIFAGGWTLDLSKLSAIDPTGQTFVLFDYAGADPTLGDWAINYGSTGWSDGQISLDLTNKQVILSNLQAVPEPGSLGLLVLAATGLLGRRRRHGR